MAATSLILCALVPAVANALDAFTALRTRSPNSALVALDGNRDGRVTFDEIALFAKTKGLDYASTLTEFAGFDGNQDGQLDLAELSKAVAPEEAVSGGYPVPAAARAARAPLLAAGAPSRAPVLGLAGGTQEASLELDSGAEAESSPQRVQLSQANGAAAEANTAAAVERRIASLSEYANLMQAEAGKEADAQELDRQAALLRANATSILRRAQQAASRSGSLAAKSKAEELFQSLVQMENDAMRAEVRAAAIKAKGDAELKAANDLLYVAQSALNSAPVSPVE